MNWPFVAALALHWVGDFVLQSRWMADNKSRNPLALAAHVGTYTLVLAPLAFWVGLAWLPIAGLNGLAHAAIDSVTSRATKALYAKGRIHDFFVVIGFDQFLHIALLYWSMEVLL